NRLINNWDLALVQFEVDKFVSFRVFSRQLFFDFPLELFLGEFFCFVQPDCTIKALTILPSSKLREFKSFAPAELSQFFSNLWWQVLVDRHQVISLAAGLGKAPFRELIKGF